MAVLPEFVPRFFEDILLDMVNVVRTNNPELTDFNIGSRIRTILEVCALEDDEQYHQMVQLSRLWNLRNLRGRKLDERLAEWNLARRGPIAASGLVVIENENIVTSFLGTAATALDPTFTILSSKGFPLTADAPFTVRIGEDTANVEDVVCTANDPTNGILTGPVTLNHDVNARVSLVTGSVLISSIGTKVRAPETIDFPEQVAILIEEARTEAGNYGSAPVRALMETPGTTGNVALGVVTEFSANPPFDGALVRNSSVFSGGVDGESDQQFLSRGFNRLQSLSGGTPLALRERILGTEFQDTTGQIFRVISANTREFFQPDSARDFVFLYIWPGGFDFISSLDVATEVLTTGAEDGQRFFRLANIAIVPSSLVLQVKRVGTPSFVNMVEGTDYFINEGTGWIQIAEPGLSEGDELQTSQYKYYTGLIRQSQVVVNGSDTDPQTFPGINSAGVKTLVTFPRPRALDPIRIAIQVRPGFSEAEVAISVEQEIVSYLTSLKIGEDVIRNEIVERAMGVDGMFDLTLSSPTGNVVLLEDEILDLEDLDILVS